MSHTQAGYIYADCAANHISCLPDGGGPYIFCDQILQHGIVEHRFGQQLLQPRVLLFERPQSSGLGYLQTAKLRLTLEECRRADPVTAADLRRRHPSFLLLQDRNDLLFVEPASLHIVRLLAPGSTKKRSHFRGARQQR